MVNSQVQQVKERLDILEIVSGYVELHKAGKHYKGKSPFVNEKTPSFFVSPDRGMYYCFSSQKGGDIFTFIEEMEGVDFKGALKILAEKAGVELVAEDPKKRDARDAQYALLQETTEFFFKNLETHPDVQKYIRDRGVTDETLYAWQIGYALDEWRTLRNHLKTKGYSDEQMLKAGLIKSADGGKEPYDVFRNRVLFPMRDASGRVIAFSGRTLTKDDAVPKYVNSPETELFQKSEILYGYDRAKQGIRSFDFSLVVEGQFDVVLAHQAGYTNTVAVSGTALTDHHVMLLQRLSNRVVLALDSDRAGVSAIKRSSEHMLEVGMDVKVVRMKDGQDPADIIKRDPSEFKKAVGGSVHVIEFLLMILKTHAKDDRTYKLQAREEVLPLLLRIPNQIDREHFEGVVAKAIDTTKDAIHFEVERIAEDTSFEPTVEKSIEAQASPKTTTRRKDLIEYLHGMKDVLQKNNSVMSDKIDSHLKKLLSDTEYEALAQIPHDVSSKLFFTIEENMSTISEKQLYEDVSHLLTQLAHMIARERLAGIRKELILAEQEGNTDRLSHILDETKAAERLLQTSIALID